MSSTKGWLAYQACGWPEPGPQMQAMADRIVEWAEQEPLEPNGQPKYRLSFHLQVFIESLPAREVMAALLDSNLLESKVDGLKLERTAYDTVAEFNAKALCTILRPVAFHAYYTAHGILDARKADAAARRARTALADGKRVTLVTHCANYFTKPR